MWIRNKFEKDTKNQTVIGYEAGYDIYDHTNVPIMSWCEDLEESALSQAINLGNHPAIFHHVAIMPDSHMGYGMPIGGVIACKDHVIPMAVGMDINCGILSIETKLHIDAIMPHIHEIRENIKRAVPVGMRWNQQPSYHPIFDLAPISQFMSRNLIKKAKKQLGTLGGGNHFIEFQTDENDMVHIMIHCGSRNLGKTIAEYYHGLALIEGENYFSNVPDKDLSVLHIDSWYGNDYIQAMEFAGTFARTNRSVIADIVIMEIGNCVGSFEIVKEYDIHHNYANLENHFGENVWVHRKGATSARKGEIGIIAGSQGTPSYIVRGKGSESSFCSCSHGAGRPMSRTQASKILVEEDCNDSMKGIIHDGWGVNRRGDIDLSEAPEAYKDIHQVMDAQTDLVDIVKELKPFAVIKDKQKKRRR